MEEWKIWKKITPCMTILCKPMRDGYEYAPMYVHSFQFVNHRNMTEMEKFFIQYRSADEIRTTAEKLRYYRYKSGLLQKDVADIIGLDRTTYVDYERTVRDYYPKEHLIKLAELFHVEVQDLLDDYNKFLYEGQGVNLKSLRKSMNLTQQGLAEKLSKNSATIRKWEHGVIRVSKMTYEKLFKSDYLMQQE